jgi:hypothetical protein
LPDGEGGGEREREAERERKTTSTYEEEMGRPGVPWDDEGKKDEVI